ncbi:hypothetical protein GCM10011379_21570 [Filimonas zeae]|uniref:histidine kinase n=1 Tax=Filimonas zeae TaxID=1737353 RepID=A0A917IWS5_9BACT|nr:hypothetical protein GCM10011379_21570 [Filimonas zeae]
MVREPDYAKAESLIYRQNDSAFYYFTRVVQHSKDSLLVAMAYNNMAAIQSDAGDYFGSQESLLTSLKYLDERRERDHYCLSSDFNELGSTSLNLKNYEAAIGYYNLALKFAQNEDYKLVFLNNKALAWQKKKDFERAIALYDSVLGNPVPDAKVYARLLSNRARTKWLQQPAYNAAPEFWSALGIRLKQEDAWGQNASYAHLSDYYARSHPDSALIYAHKMYTVARQLNSADDEMEALQKLIALSTATSSKQYFTRYQYLNDSTQTARSNAKNQFALIRYESEKNKAENLELQKENADKKLQIIQQWFVIGGVLLILFYAWGWYRKRKRKLEWRAQNAIREHQLKTSQKVHDVVANGLYRIMVEVEHQEVIDKESLLDKIEEMYEQSRDISYEHTETAETDFQEAVAGLFETFATQQTKVMGVGNNKALWQKVDARAKTEVRHILQELLVNMKKHSHADNVVIRFEQVNNQVNILYTDDGVGLPAGNISGNGLTNTGNRIQGLNGTITFDTGAVKGTRILISFPIEYTHD